VAHYTSVFEQLLKHVPHDEFNAIVARFQGDKGMRRFSCWKQFTALFYAQLTGQHSLRDLITAVNSNLHKLRQVGLSALSRSTLADANARRPAEIFQHLFACLYRRCLEQAPGHAFHFPHKIYSLDASIVDLSLKVFDWAKFRKRKGAIKLHLMLDHDGHIPSFCVITPGREHEIEVARKQHYQADSILIFDRGYVDYHWFDQIHRQGVFFVTRQKRNARYRVLQRRKAAKRAAVTSDQTIRLTGKAAECLSTDLRRIGYRDPETGHFYAFLTNIFHLTAQEIAELYRSRWQIELFFKWVKQHLKIKSFLGTSRNAVMTQVWVALCTYLLVAYLKFLTRVPWRPYEIYKRLQVAALEYLSLGGLLGAAPRNSRKSKQRHTQLNLLGRHVKPLFVIG